MTGEFVKVIPFLWGYKRDIKAGIAMGSTGVGCVN
jgi:hypothetical protein